MLATLLRWRLHAALCGCVAGRHQLARVANSADLRRLLSRVPVTGVIVDPCVVTRNAIAELEKTSAPVFLWIVPEESAFRAALPLLGATHFDPVLCSIARCDELITRIERTGAQESALIARALAQSGLPARLARLLGGTGGGGCSGAVETVAREACVSRRTLERRLKRAGLRGPRDLLRAAAVSAYYNALRRGMDVKEAAGLAGFPAPEYARKWACRVLGCSAAATLRALDPALVDRRIADWIRSP